MIPFSWLPPPPPPESIPYTVNEDAVKWLAQANIPFLILTEISDSFLIQFKNLEHYESAKEVIKERAALVALASL